MSIVAGTLRLTGTPRPLPGAMKVALAAAGAIAVAASGTVDGGSVPLVPIDDTTKRASYWGYAFKAANVGEQPQLANGAIVEGFTGLTQGGNVYIADDGSLTHSKPTGADTTNIPLTDNLGDISATKVLTFVVPAGVTTFAGLQLVVKTTVAAHDTNYWTVAAVNKSNSDAALLAATDANTTKATGGSALTAYTARDFDLTATTGDLAVEPGDVIEVTLTKASSAANLVQTDIQLNFTATESGDVDPIGIAVRTTAIYFFAR